MIRGGRFPALRAPEGLAGPPGGLPCLGRTLGWHQEQALARAGAALAEGDDPSVGRVLVREDVLARPEAIRALIAAGQERGQDLSWGVDGEAGALRARLGLGQQEGPALVWLAPGGAASAERIQAAEAVIFPSKERLLPAPILQEGRAVGLPVTDRLVLPMGHWCQALWANLLGLGPFLWQEILGRNPALALLRLALAALRARSLQPERLLSRVVRRGRGCRIHPSAVVEAAHLGEGVRIGAGAVVRASVLGDGVVVEDQALVEGCSLGPGVLVQRQAMVKYSVLAEGAAFGGIMQLGVLDRRSLVKHTAVLMDMAWGGPVRVNVGESRVEAPFGLLGVCVGEGSTLGAGVQVAPGRWIPPGLAVAAGGDALLRRVRADLSGLCEVRGGELVPR